MQRTVRLFAVARELADATQLALELPAGANVRDLRRALAARAPALAPVIDQLQIAIDSDYATDETTIPADAEIAVIPPVSGG